MLIARLDLVELFAHLREVKAKLHQMVGIVPNQPGETNTWKDATDLPNRLVAVRREKPAVVVKYSNAGFDDGATVRDRVA